MSLTLLSTNDECLGGASTLRLAGALLKRGGATVLVRTFAQALLVQKSLADAGLSLGASVTTPDALVRDLWDLWGDGRRVVDDATRALLIGEVLKNEAEGTGPATGTVRLLSSLAKEGLPFMDEALEKNGEALSPAERGMAQLLGDYAQLLEEHGLVEGAACACELPAALSSAGASCPNLLLVGLDRMTRAERAFVTGVARGAEVTFVLRETNEYASESARALAGQLEEESGRLGVEVRRDWMRVDASEGDSRHCDELRGLGSELFRASGAHVPQAGAVRLLEPSGPLAEAELVAREAASLAGEGKGDLLVVVPSTRQAWHELAQKLVARGLAVRTTLSVPTLHTSAGGAFMAFASAVAQLQELASTWPEPVEGADGTYYRLGPMDWWPPKGLVDFLLHDISQVGAARAHSLDAKWRGDRLLSPEDVLQKLLNPRATSPVVAQATRELLKGRVGSAASKLLQSYPQRGVVDPSNPTDAVVSLEHEECVAVLAKVLGAAGTLKELGVTADPNVPGSVDLTTLVGQVELLLAGSSVTLRPVAQPAHPVAEVLLASRGQAAGLEPASFDAAIVCGLTSQEYAVPSVDNELRGMLEDLGIEARRDPLLDQRAEFHRICSLPRTDLLLERAMFTADAHETYPAVMLTEVLSCYADSLPKVPLAEEEACANLSARGVAPSEVGRDVVAPAGHISNVLRDLVAVPQAGQELRPGELPLLSASQLESYLECPLKWFSLRRLRLGDNDAGFGGAEMGTFAHRVLELTYTQLREEGCARLDARDTKAMAHAREVLESCFASHLEHQYIRSGSRGVYQALVAHTSSEESALEVLLRDLLSTLDYDAQRMLGYEPRAFEWSFGRGHEEEGATLPAPAEVTYAGVRVTGTVDRIDVNGHGQAIVVDYKHKSPAGFFAEYAAFGKATGQGKPADKDAGQDKPAGQPADAKDFVLPRRIQSLMYAQVVRRALPDLRVVGALYLCTRGIHELSGAVEQNQADNVFGGTLGPRRETQVVVSRGQSFGCADASGFEALLDATEEAIAAKVERLRAGHIEAEPLDAEACSFCPVNNCERRIQP